MSDADRAARGLCARNRCKFIILGLGLALAAAPGPLGYSGDSTAMTGSVGAGIVVWICALAALIGPPRLMLAACAASGIAAAVAPWLLGFQNLQQAVLVHEAAGVAIALISLTGLAFATERANVPIRV